MKTPENSTIVITHYQRLLDYIVPDFVHILYEGKIAMTGDKTLALKLTGDDCFEITPVHIPLRSIPCTKTITVTAYAESRAESELINGYLSQCPQKFKRVVQS